MRVLFAAMLAGLTITGCATTQSGTAAGGSNTASGVASTPPGSGSTTGSGSISGSAGSGSGSAPGAGGTARPSAPSDNATASVRCPSELNPAQFNGPQSRAVPADIDVTWVLRCSVVTKNGTTRTVLAERSDSDPTALLTALRAPSEPRTSGVCPMFRVMMPYFALVQSNGKVLVPKVPLTKCAMPQPAVLQALNAMRFEAFSSKPLP